MAQQVAQLRQNDAPYPGMPDRQCFERAHTHVGAGSAWCPRFAPLLGYLGYNKPGPRPRFVCSEDPADAWERIETCIEAQDLRDVMLFHHGHVHGIPS